MPVEPGRQLLHDPLIEQIGEGGAGIVRIVLGRGDDVPRLVGR